MENQFHNSRTGRVWAGLFLVGIGILLLADRIGMGLPAWVFSWPMLLIAIGAFIGLRHRFRGGAWLIMIVIGSIFLFDIISPDYSLRRYFWPIIIMVLGLIMILKPRSSGRWRSHHRWRRQNYAGDTSQTDYMAKPVQDTQYIPVEEAKPKTQAPGDYLDSAAIFGGIRKAFFTKDFKGGEAVSVFGGHEIDLSKSDITGTVTLELTQIFGGTKLIVPNNWNVKSEVVAFLGGIEDKRHTDTTLVDPDKILLLKGTSILGGIDIRSF
jgi:predicted membrane protein